jgi:hypothetical protein
MKTLNRPSRTGQSHSRLERISNKNKSISVKEVRGEDEHDGELGQLLQQLPGGDAQKVRSFTGIIKILVHLLIRNINFNASLSLAPIKS